MVEVMRAVWWRGRRLGRGRGGGWVVDGVEAGWWRGWRLGGGGGGGDGCWVELDMT